MPSQRMSAADHIAISDDPELERTRQIVELGDAWESAKLKLYPKQEAVQKGAWKMFWACLGLAAWYALQQSADGTINGIKEDATDPDQIFTNVAFRTVLCGVASLTLCLTGKSKSVALARLATLGMVALTGTFYYIEYVSFGNSFTGTLGQATSVAMLVTVTYCCVLKGILPTHRYASALKATHAMRAQQKTLIKTAATTVQPGASASGGGAVNGGFTEAPAIQVHEVDPYQASLAQAGAPYMTQQQRMSAQGRRMSQQGGDPRRMSAQGNQQQRRLSYQAGPAPIDPRRLSYQGGPAPVDPRRLSYQGGPAPIDPRRLSNQGPAPIDPRRLSNQGPAPIDPRRLSNQPPASTTNAAASPEAMNPFYDPTLDPTLHPSTPSEPPPAYPGT